MMRLKSHMKGRYLLAHALIIMLICTMVLPLQAEDVSALTAPGKVTLNSVTKKGKTLTVKWNQVSGCSGYQVQYSPDRFFLGKKTKTVKKSKKTSVKIRKLVKGATYYVRIRAYKKSKKQMAYSEWTTYQNFATYKNVSMKQLKSGLKKFELRSAAGQPVGGYDTMQGGCCGGGYAYFILNNRNTAKCKIAKVRIKGMKVVKVSGVLNLGHGNDMTFNTKTRQLVVSHSTGATKTVTVVNSGTLEPIYSVKVELPEDLPGIYPGQRKYYNGFGAIAYNEAHNQYVVLLRGTNFHHLMILDSQFTPVRFIQVAARPDQTVQGMDSLGNSILVTQSYSSGKPYNNILIYDWDGNFQAKMNLGKKYEIESIYHTGSTFYLGFYTSYYKYKKGKGNQLQRDSYVFKVTSL